MGMLFRNSSPNGFYIGNNVISRILLNQNVVWENETEVQPDSPLKLTSIGNSTVRFKPSTQSVYLEQSLDNGATWTTHSNGTTISLSDGESLMLRAVDTNPPFGTANYNYAKFIMTGTIKASGNVYTLLNKTGNISSIGRYGFTNIFDGCTSLIKAPQMVSSVTTVNFAGFEAFFRGTSITEFSWTVPASSDSWSFTEMFANTNLKSAKNIKFTQIENITPYAYSGMFQNCTSLTEPPQLVSTVLNQQTYQSMFQGCTSLTKAPELKVTALGTDCFRYMFANSGVTHFTVDMTACTSVPRLPSSDLFSNAYKDGEGVVYEGDYTVLVPSSLYDSWITATNWSTIKANIQAV